MLLAAAILFLTGSALFSGFYNAEQHRTGLESLFEEEYSQGSVLSLPEYTMGGESVQGVLLYPDGTAKKTSVATLDQAGRYTVSYSLTQNGVYREESTSFLVPRKAYNLQKSDSTAQYSAEKGGIAVSLAPGDTFTYGGIVDLRGVTSEDDFLTLSIDPTTPGSADFKELYITLTDVYDVNNYVTIYANQYAEPALSYILASACGQPMVGVEFNGTVHTDEWGHSTAFSFYGKPYDSQMRLRYDEKTRSLYMKEYRPLDGFVTPPSRGDDYVVDLDDPAFFDKTWEGFTSGEVYISIRADSYNAGKASFVLESLRGVRNLSETEIHDTQAPEITVSGGEESSLPPARLGVRYPIPEAAALDKLDGAVPVLLEAVYDYGGNEISIDVSEGSFLPAWQGQYALVYRAHDRSGNVAEKVFLIDVEASASDLGLALADEITDGVVGSEIILPGVTVLGEATDGAVSVTVFIRSPAGEEQSYRLEKAGENLFEGVHLTPYELGKYTIVYTAAAANGVCAELKTSLNVGKPKAPILIEAPELPEFFVSGRTYDLPQAVVTDFSSGEGKPADVRITWTDTSEHAAENGAVTPVLSANGYTVIRYIAGNTVVFEQSVPTGVLKDENQYVNFPGYFVPLQGASWGTASAEGVRLTSAGSSLYRYAKDLPLSAARFIFKVNPEKNEFDRINLYMTGVENPQERIMFSIFPGTGSTSYLTVNGGRRSYAINGSFSGTGYSLRYIPMSHSITDDGLLAPLAVRETLDGKSFQGFTGNAYTLEIEIAGAESEAELVWNAIGGQYFRGNTGSDAIAPSIFINGEHGGLYSRGTQVVLPAAEALDILSFQVSLKLSVKAPDGSDVKSLDGVVLKEVAADRAYTVLLEQNGRYVITLTASDENGNTNRSGGYLIYVADRQPPVIDNVPGGVEGKVGQRLTLPKAEVSDNESQECRLTLSCIDPYGRVTAIADGALVPSLKGTYLVYYIATDESSNVTVATCAVYVR